MLIYDWLLLTFRAKSLDDLKIVIGECAEDIGYHKFSLRMFPKNINDRARHPSVLTNTDDKWREYYLANGYERNDPTMTYCFKANTVNRPLLWNSKLSKQAWQGKGKIILSEAEGAGVRNGVVIPLYSKSYHVSILGFFDPSQTNYELYVHRNWQELKALGEMAFIKYQDLERQEVKPIYLSDKSVLHLYETGATFEEIADICSIPAESVYEIIRTSTR